MDDYELTTVRERDIAEMSRIHMLSFYEGWSGIMIRRILSTSNACGLVARSRRRWFVAGFALLRITIDECEILSLVVTPECRGNGIGGIILDGAVQKAGTLGAGKIFLEVAEDNHIALALYDRRGFVPVGRRPDYYGNKDGTRTAAITMSSVLGEKRLELFGG